MEKSGLSPRQKKKNRRKKDRTKPEKTLTSKRWKTKPDAIVIGKSGELSYAELLKKVNDDPSLKKIGETVARVRGTFKGELLIELNKDVGADNGPKFHTMVQNVLGDQVKVRSLSHQLLIECRDLDEITSNEKIHQALAKQSGIQNLDVFSGQKLTAAHKLQLSACQ